MKRGNARFGVRRYYNRGGEACRAWKDNMVIMHFPSTPSKIWEVRVGARSLLEVLNTCWCGTQGGATMMMGEEASSIRRVDQPQQKTSREHWPQVIRVLQPAENEPMGFLPSICGSSYFV